MFCVPCVLFGTASAGGVALNRLVSTSLQNVSHLTGRDGYLTAHLSKKYHEDICFKAMQFEKVAAGEANTYDQLNQAAAIVKNRNRAVLKRNLPAIVFLARCGLPLRGHRDSGNPETLAEVKSDERVYKKGNFRALLRFMTDCGDEVIQSHITTCSQNATYISWNSQNQLIAAIGIVLKNKVVNEVNESKFFTLTADETTDISGVEQLSVCLRYVYSGKLHERLLQLVEAPDLSGSGIATQLLTVLQNVGIDSNFMLGQCYDGAASMSGQRNGVQKHIRDKYPHALYTRCVSHRLNLCIAKACSIREIQVAMCTMKGISIFFSTSSKCLSILHSQIEPICPNSSHSRLKRDCSTRWVKNQEDVHVFKEIFPAVIGALNKLTESRGGEVIRKAMSHLKILTSPDFVICMEVLNAVMNITKPVATKL